MATVPPQELLSQWSHESITAEMATGQIIQHLVGMQLTVEGLQRRVSTLQSELEQLKSVAAAPNLPEPKQRKASQR